MRSKDGSQSAAITHADLDMKKLCRELGGRVGTCVLFIALLSGMLSFILALIAASSHFKMKAEEWRWVLYEEIGSSVSATLGILVIHLHIWDATTHKHHRRQEPIGLTWVLDGSKFIVYQKQAALLFFAAWTCFIVGQGMILWELVTEVWQMKDGGESVGVECMLTPYWVLIVAGLMEILATLFSTGFYGMLVKLEKEREWEISVATEMMEVRRELAMLDQIAALPSSTSDGPLHSSGRQTTSPTSDEEKTGSYL